MSLAELMETHAPITSDLVAVECVGVESRADGGAATTVRLIIWELDGEQRMIRDLKEQELRWSAEQLADPRLDAFVAGWAAALGEVFAAISEVGDVSKIECYLPCDLLELSALRLKRPRSADDFRDALLQPSRLGKLLPAW
ncbi:MAG: hypothetical protein KC486_34680 [Myxococcales bacterium]|nr:hypothetical protein [Myxococcales bacterium]